LSKNFTLRRTTSGFDEKRPDLSKEHPVSTKNFALRRRTSGFVERLPVSTKNSALRRKTAGFDETGHDLTKNCVFWRVLRLILLFGRPALNTGLQSNPQRANITTRKPKSL
jgi:hypothetical protein